MTFSSDVISLTSSKDSFLFTSTTFTILKSCLIVFYSPASSHLELALAILDPGLAHPEELRLVLVQVLSLHVPQLSVLSNLSSECCQAQDQVSIPLFQKDNLSRALNLHVRSLFFRSLLGLF